LAPLLVTPATRQSAISSSRDLKNDIDNTGDSSGILPRSRSVNRNSKGLRPHRQKSIGAYLARPKAGTHSKLAAVIASFKMRQWRTAMALKVELKPHERIIIGNCVITNTDQRARLLIDGDKIPILREKDILTPETADTPAKLVYLAVQLMYISPDPQVNHGTYFSLVRDIVTAAPSAWPIIEGINNHILNGDLYQALKEARKLVAYERTLLDHNEAVQSEQGAGAEARRSA
jgi:flagellar biosynthesis repressor protein FlbT